MSDSYATMSPAELTELQMMLDGKGRCENCWWAWTDKTFCDSCSEEAHQKENVRRYGNVPQFQEWNPLKRTEDEILEHPYHAEMESIRYSKHP